MFKVKLSCKVVEAKAARTLDKFSKNSYFRYTIKSTNIEDSPISIDFDVKNLAARNELIRRFRHIRDFQLLEIQTERGRSDGV